MSPRPGASAPIACPSGGERPLTRGEIALASSVFGRAIAYDQVTIRRRKWFVFQTAAITMAPRGHIHFHPRSRRYHDDFSVAPLRDRALFIHEMVHVWQTQTRGPWFLIARRHPWCRYGYVVRPGWPLERYGIEQQAMIVEHAYCLREGAALPGAPDLAWYLEIIPFEAFRE